MRDAIDRLTERYRTKIKIEEVKKSQAERVEFQATRQSLRSSRETSPGDSFVSQNARCGPLDSHSILMKTSPFSWLRRRIFPKTKPVKHAPSV